MIKARCSSVILIAVIFYSMMITQAWSKQKSLVTGELIGDIDIAGKLNVDLHGKSLSI